MSFFKKVVFINFILIFLSGLLLSGFIRFALDFYVEDKYADALLV